MITSLRIIKKYILLLPVALWLFTSPSAELSQINGIPVQQANETVLLDFEDLPPAAEYYGGDVVPLIGKVLIGFSPYRWPANGEAGEQEYIIDTSGIARVENEDVNGMGQTLRMGNINVDFLFVGTANEVQLEFSGECLNPMAMPSDDGGNAKMNTNLRINGSQYVMSYMRDLIQRVNEDGEIEAILDKFNEEPNVNWPTISNCSGILRFVGKINTFSIGGQNLAVDNVSINLDALPRPQQMKSPQAVRILLITRDNKVIEHHVAILPGYARGHANQFNQWLVTILNEKREPLDVYGIWDPRLTLVHDISPTVHSEWQFDDETSYLFDIVFPFTNSSNPYNDKIPLEVLLHDQELRLLADIDLSDAIEDFCSRESARTLQIGFDETVENQYRPGTVITGDVTIEFLPYFNKQGNTVGGLASIEDSNNAGGTAPELLTSNINARFTFGQIARIVTLMFREKDEDLNLAVNGDQRYGVGSLWQLEDTVIGGVTLRINRTETGWQLNLTGPIKTFSIGGRELYIDDVEIGLMYPECFVNLQSFEPMTNLYGRSWESRPIALPTLPLHSIKNDQGSYMGDSRAVAQCVTQGVGAGITAQTAEEWSKWLTQCGREVEP